MKRLLSNKQRKLRAERHKKKVGFITINRVMLGKAYPFTQFHLNADDVFQLKLEPLAKSVGEA